MGNTCQTSLHKCYKLCDCEEIPPFTFNTENECSLSFHSNNINSKSINNNTINNNSNINQSNNNSYSNQVILSNNVSSISIQNDEDDNDNTFQLNSQPHIILTSPYKSNNSSHINLSSFIANFNTETNYSSESLNSPLSPHFYSAQPFSSRSNNHNNNNNTNDITTYTTDNNNNNVHTKDSIVLQKILLIQSTFKSFLISKRESEYNLLKNKKSISTSDITNSIPKASIFLSYLKSNYTIIHPPNCKRHSKQGICKILWEDNSLLIGNYINNQLNGVGNFQLQNSSIYKGYFKHNLFNGYGVYITPEKTKIEGTWVKGKLNGFGFKQEPFIFGDLIGFTVYRDMITTEEVIDIFNSCKKTLKIDFEFHISDGYYETNNYIEANDKYFRGYLIDLLSKLHKPHNKEVRKKLIKQKK